METRAAYIAVGTAVLVLFFAGLGFVLWMAQYDSDASFKRYSIFFDGSVAGLRTGSSVSYRGITVGEVVDLRIDPNDHEKVRATVEVLATTPVKTNTVASLELQGLTGGSLIMLDTRELKSGDAPPGDLEREDGQRYPQIPSRPSQLERIFDGAPALVERIDALVNSANLLLNPQNRREISRIVANTATLSDELAKAGPDLRELIANAKTVSDRVDRITAATEDDLADTLSATATTMRKAETALAAAEKAFADLQGAADTIGGAAGTLDSMLAENRRPLRDFTHVTLYDMNAFIADLRELIVTMRRVANELGRDPAGFLFGNQQKGYEAR